VCKTKPITNCGRNSKKWMRIPTSQAMTPGRSLYPRNGFPNLSEDKRARSPPISQPRAKRFQGYRRIPQHPLTTRTSGIVHGAIEESHCLTPPQSDSKPPNSRGCMRPPGLQGPIPKQLTVARGICRLMWTPCSCPSRSAKKDGR